MIRKWFAAQGFWLFIVVVMGGFGFLIYRADLLNRSLEKQCTELGDIQRAEKSLENYPEFDPYVGQTINEYYLQRVDFEKLIKQCKTLQSRQTKN